MTGSSTRIVIEDSRWIQRERERERDRDKKKQRETETAAEAMERRRGEHNAFQFKLILL